MTRHPMLLHVSIFAGLGLLCLPACGGEDTVPAGSPDVGVPVVDGGAAPEIDADAERPPALPDGGLASDAAPADAPSPDGSPAPGGACAHLEGADVSAGTRDVRLSFDGDEREYVLTVPTAHGTAPLPLVFDIHGYTESAGRQDGRNGMRDKAEEEGFILVQPEGSGSLKSWNGGACCGTAASGGLDDVGLIRAIYDDVAASTCVDTRRVYATGLSNGGFLSHRLACQASDLFAAIAPVAGVIGIDTSRCSPERPVSVMQVHGTSDLLVPYGGNPFWGYPSVADTVAHWSRTNGCAEDSTVTFREGSATCRTWSSCEAGTEVVLCTLEGGGHTWPRGSSDLPTTDAVWDFFASHAR